MTDASQPSASLEGQTVAGKYLLVRRLGEGGMCVVYEAEHVGLRQGLALKMLRPELARDPDCVARFEREARAAAQLRSPNVAKVFDVDYLPGGQPYITMELLAGHDLGRELRASQRLPVDVAVDYVRQACAGIAEAHALGIVHRDLKPENLFLTDLGHRTDRKLLKILDFGIAKNIADSARRLTAPDAVFGTVDYMSPEQIRSASKVDPRSDLWSLGVILYESLTGRTPFHGDARAVIAQIASEPVPPPTDFAPNLPPALVRTVMRLLEKNPDRRFQSAEDLRAALDGYSELEPITSVVARLPPQTIPRRSMPPAMRADAGRAPAETLWAGHTHGAWETRDERRPWARTRRATPAVVIALCALGAFAFVRFSGWRSSGAHVEVTTNADAVLAPAPVASLASVTPSAMPTSMSVLAPEADAGLSPITTSPAKPSRSRRLPIPTRPAAGVATTSPSTAAPRLPKHL